MKKASPAQQIAREKNFNKFKLSGAAMNIKNIAECKHYTQKTRQKLRLAYIDVQYIIDFCL